MISFKLWLEKQNTDYKFSSTQINAPQEIAKKIIDWSKKHIKDKDLRDHGREDEIHITALYGLHTNSPKPVKEIIKNVKPFEIKFGKISKFDTENYDVIKIDIDSPGIRKLNKTLKKLPYTSDFPIYTPHCTIAYVVKDSYNDLIGKDFSDISFTADKLVFSPKDGDKVSLNLYN